MFANQVEKTVRVGWIGKKGTAHAHAFFNGDITDRK